MKESQSDTPNPDGAEEQPEVYAVSNTDTGFEFSRRDFIEIAGVVAAGSIVAGGLIGAESAAAQSRCTARTSEDDVQVHVGPGRNRGIRMYMPRNQDIPIIGQAQDREDNLWWQLSIEDIDQAWVADEDVVTRGNCTSVEIVGTPPVRTPSGPRATPTARATEVPPELGPVPAGTEGAQYSLRERTYHLPCGSPIPAGATCVCNCVTVPAPPRSCTCDSVCTCDTVCSCVGETHYWYPN